jgi:hypothetical protein
MELIELRVHLQPHDNETSGAYPMAIDKAAKNLKIYTFATQDIFHQLYGQNSKKIGNAKLLDVPIIID